MPAPGSRASGKRPAFKPAGGRAGTRAMNRANTGPASTIAGTAMMIP